MGGPAGDDLEGLAILHEVVIFDGEAATVNGIHTINNTSSNQRKAQQKDSLIAGHQTRMRHASAEGKHLRDMASMQESVADFLSSPGVRVMSQRIVRASITPPRIRSITLAMLHVLLRHAAKH